jgi:hypothetical protein
MKQFLAIITLFVSVFSEAQTNSFNHEEAPIFVGCETLFDKNLDVCFKNKVEDFVFENFKVPTILSENNFKGKVVVVFEVTSSGVFVIKYIDAVNAEMIDECNRVIRLFPKVKPQTYNGVPTFAQYIMNINIPIISRAQIEMNAEKEAESLLIDNKQITEIDKIVSKKFQNSKFESHLNIPFSHDTYSQFDAALNQVGANNHTATKPYTYSDVSKYFNLKEDNNKIKKQTSSWWGKKFWNENLIEFQGTNFWFSLNPIFDLQLGKSTIKENQKTTFVNTRGIQFQGGLGSQLNFTTTIYESQGIFAEYYNNYAESIKPSGGNPAIIPGIGIAKRFNTDAYDFPLAEANLTFTPSKLMNFQLGYGRNFIGDGYRSLLISDGASPYPFFKINTTFWKIKYTNTYAALKDVTPDATVDGTYATKYMANHYLSINLSNSLNIGLFESVIWANTNNRGFDANFINPIIFYRTTEFNSSSKSGNALLGMTFKYKYNKNINLYGQLLVDEFSFSEIKNQNNSWKNKYGYQLGAKYYNAFNVNNLLLQFEYNKVRPYVYSHSNSLTNYGHNNQSLGHQWGANFREFIAIARYHKGRIYADAKFTFGEQGLDFNTIDDNFNYGGNIYKSYDTNRPFETNVNVGQGNKATLFITDLQFGYLINPSSNLKLFTNCIYRNFFPTNSNQNTFNNNTLWFSVGLRADLFNWYFDY